MLVDIAITLPSFGIFLLFSGKVNFGYIYGLGALGSIMLWFIFSLMAPIVPVEATSTEQDHRRQLSSTLTFARSASILGYCLCVSHRPLPRTTCMVADTSSLPLVLVSLLGIILPMDNILGYLLTSFAIAWSSVSSSAMFTAVGRMHEMRLLVAYPSALFYTGFGIMAIFSSRGSGTLQAKTMGS